MNRTNIIKLGKIFAILVIVFFVTQPVFAADGGGGLGSGSGRTSGTLCQSQSLQQGFKAIVGCALSIISLAVPLLVGFALLAFLYGLLNYVTQGGNAEARTKASHYIIFGTIGLFVMISVYGLVNILLNTFTGSGGSSIDNAPKDVFDPYFQSGDQGSQYGTGSTLEPGRAGTFTTPSPESSGAVFSPGEAAGGMQ